jgi:hypothetical protein
MVPETFDVSRALAGEGLRIAQELGNPTASLFAAFGVGFVESIHDPAVAIDWLRESLDFADPRSVHHMATVAAGFLCRCYAAVGDTVRASRTMQRGVLVARDTGSRAMLAQILDFGGQALITLGRDEEGATLVAAATRGFGGSRTLAGHITEDRAATESAARARLGRDRYEAVVHKGVAMMPEAAIAYSLDFLDRPVESERD